MATYVVWMDLDQAKVFKIMPDKTEARILHRTEIKHHTSNDPANHKDGEKFFHELAQKLAGAAEILLLGPGLAKEHFKAHLERHHHQELGSKIVGTLTVDHPTDKEVLAQSRKFFKIYDLYA